MKKNPKEIKKFTFLQSKRDGRLAYVKGLSEDRVFLYLEKLGERNFPKVLVSKGFKVLETNEEIIKTYFLNNYSVRKLFDEEVLFLTSMEIYDSLKGFVSGLTNLEIIRILKGIVKEIENRTKSYPYRVI